MDGDDALDDDYWTDEYCYRLRYCRFAVDRRFHICKLRIAIIARDDTMNDLQTFSFPPFDCELFPLAFV